MLFEKISWNYLRVAYQPYPYHKGLLVICLEEEQYCEQLFCRSSF